MHCKDVSVHDTDIELNEQNISDLMDGWTAYVRTEFLVLRNGKDLAVLRLIKKPGTDLFRELEIYETVSMPEDTVFVNDPDVDVLNLPAMATVQAEHPGKTVVIEGMFSHINFLKDLAPLRLRVIDNVPPVPSKLGVLVDIALGSGFVDHPVIVEKIDIDMADKLPDVSTEGVMFPCRVSGLTADIPVYFLDEAPERRHKVTLIGCNLSQRIYSSVYGEDVPFIDVCPADNLILDGVKTIVKCCKVKSGHVIEGDVATVPWGATVPEVVEAINSLFSD